MPLNINDITGAGAPATPAPGAPADAAPAPTDPLMKNVLGVTGGDAAAAAKAVAHTGTTPQPGTLSPPLEPKDPEKHSLPDEVLQIPAFRALLNGEPPAVGAHDSEQDPDITTVRDNVQPLLYGGFGFYRNLANDATYIYNGRFMDGNALKIADQKGKLDQIVPPFSELKGAFTAGLAEDATSANPDTAPVPASATPDVAAPPQMAPPAAVPGSVTNARLKNIAVGSPTSGPAPGQGRILNSVLKTAV